MADGYWLIFKCAAFVVIAVIVAFVTFGIRSYHCRCSVCEGYFMAPDRMTICQSCAMIQAGEKP